MARIIHAEAERESSLKQKRGFMTPSRVLLRLGVQLKHDVT